MLAGVKDSLFTLRQLHDPSAILVLSIILTCSHLGSMEMTSNTILKPIDDSIPVQQITERTNIFFLKAHKCASSTVQNILLRFGIERGLTFVLPSLNNYIGNPDFFTANMINKMYTTSDQKYNIFAHHTRYNSEEIHSVMYEDAAYVTIVRHPADLYESIFSYYGFEKLYKLSFNKLLTNPGSINKITRRHFKRIGFNQMSWDLGLLEKDFNNTPVVEKFIKKIENEFDLVMMSEWMEVSLVLLADLMNWPLENVMSLKLNSRTPDSIYVMSDIERQRVIELNSADYKLYTHFLNRFRKRIIDYGEQRMKNDVEKLLELNRKLNLRCVRGLNTSGFGHTKGYKLRDPSDRLCFYAARPELSFTEDLRQQQKYKVKVIRKLDSLLNDYEDFL